MEDDLDLVVGRDLIEQIAVHDVAGVGLEAEAAIRLGQGRQVDGDDAIAPVGVQTLEERSTDFTVGAGDEDDGRGHGAGRYNKSHGRCATSV